MSNQKIPIVRLSERIAIIRKNNKLTQKDFSLALNVSRSYILLLLGMYKPVLDAIHDKDFKIIGLLGAGAIVGLLSFSRLLKWLFDHYQNLTLATLTGFIVGSLNKIWPWKKVINSEMINGKLKILQEKSVSPFKYEGDNELYFAIALAFVGFMFIVFLEKLAVKKED